MVLRALVLGVLWLGATVGVNLGGASGADAGAALGALDAPATVAAPQEPRAKPFSHREHVPSVWFEGSAETWRDCRGCHRFTATQTVSTPQRECAPCHGQGQLAVKADKGFENDLSGHRTRTRDAFRHHTHGMLECRQCHLPKDAEFGAENLRIVTGPGSCAPCHEPGRVDADAVGGFRWFTADLDKADVAAELGVPTFTRPGDAAAYATKLTELFAGPTGGLNTTPLPIGGDFHHGDHLAIACADCHSNIPGASSVEVGTGAIPVAACKQCHVRDALGTAAAAQKQGDKKERELAALGTFAHRDHYGWQAGRNPGTKKNGVCTASAYEAIEKGCAACHTYVPVPGGLAERDFPFGSGRSKETYAGCQTCHAVPGWSTGETAQAPLHGSSGANAADGAGWRVCTACHVFGGGDLAHERPQVEVQRWSERTFVFPANTHPDVTARGIAEAQRDGRAPLAECRECHRARVPELATRLAQKTFRHDVHLPANATAATCLGCHPTAGAAADGPGLAAGDFRTYTLASCQKCHWGGNVTELPVAAAQPPTKRVVAFPHGPHVSTAKQACTECHVLGKDGVDVGTKPEALACAQCHDHKEGGSRAEKLFGDDVQSCAKCHRDPTTGPAPARAIAAVPPVRGSAATAADARYRVAQDVFAGFADAQFHPLGTRCNECHKDEAAVELPIVDHIVGTQQPRFHGAGPKQPADCLRCHWKPVGEWAAAVNGSQAPAADKAPRATPESAEVRRLFGNSAKGYPGTDKAKG